MVSPSETNKTTEETSDMATNMLKQQVSSLTLQGTPQSPEEVLARCQHLLNELQIFADYCGGRKYNGDYRRNSPEYKHFRSDIQNEVKQMEKLKTTPDLAPERASQLVSASNLTYWEALWNAAKLTKQIGVLRRHGSPVDIVSENGTRWTKVSTVTEKRLLMEMAKQGWDWAGSDDDSEDETYGSSSQKATDDDLDISLVKMAVTLRDMAKESRVRYQHPTIQFILTRITPSSKDITRIIDAIRATGAVVHTADTLTTAPPIQDVLEDLIIDDFKFFTPTLNVDCTLLLAIVSDISHGQVVEEPWFNRNVRNQIRIEEQEQLMPQSLWPAMSDRKLVCTKLAAKRMREIVETIGTPTEKQRMAVLMGDDGTSSPEELKEKFRELSVHEVPDEWQVPIQVMDEDALEQESASQFQKDVMAHLFDVNRSVFMYGWLSGYTTISSNRVATKTVEKAVEDHRKLLATIIDQNPSLIEVDGKANLWLGLSDQDRGPDVWICPTARSLVAKEKNRPVHSSSSKKSSPHDSGEEQQPE